MATLLCGEPHFAHDIDIVFYVNELKAANCVVAFPLELFDYPPEEMLLVESRRSVRGHFNCIHHESGFRANVYFASDDAFYQWAQDLVQNRKIAESESLSLLPNRY